jgi:hypothetical protein
MTTKEENKDNTLDEILGGLDYRTITRVYDNPPGVYGIEVQARVSLEEQAREITKSKLIKYIEGEISKGRVGAREGGILDGRQVERARWITPIQQKVLTEISACLSPRIIDLINHTGLGNSTIQKALTKLIRVGIVSRIGDRYHLAENSMYVCKYGCKDVGLHYHNEFSEAKLNTRGESNER